MWRALAKRADLLRDVVVGGLLCAAGDTAAQLAFGHGSDQHAAGTTEHSAIDRQRLGAMWSYGSVAAVPRAAARKERDGYHYYYKYLALLLPASAVWTKTFLECFVVTPCFEIPAIVTWTGMLGRNQSFDEALEQLRDDFPRAFVYGLAIWGPNGLLMFKLAFDGTTHGHDCPRE